MTGRAFWVAPTWQNLETSLSNYPEIRSLLTAQNFRVSALDGASQPHNLLLITRRHVITGTAYRRLHQGESSPQAAAAVSASRNATSASHELLDSSGAGKQKDDCGVLLA